MPGDFRRIRVYLSELGATKEARESTRRAARREYLVLQGIDHPGIVKAEQYSDEHELGPSIVFRHDREALRLDHYMARFGATLDIDTRLDMVRQLAEALDHAHRRHLYHRALAARSVYVSFYRDGRYPKLRIGDWQAAARAATSTRRSGVSATRSAAAHVERSAAPYLAPEFDQPEAEGVPLDVFGLGALSYLILTGQPPANDRADLMKRLSAENGLVPSAVSDTITPAMDELVANATRSEVYERFESVRDFLEYLDLVEEELTAPAPEEETDPLEAAKGSVVGGWTIERVLGKGSTARALLASRDGQRYVLKVALTEETGDRLVKEAALLRQLNDSRIVRLVDGPLQLGGRTVIVLEEAGERTLADHLRREGRLSIDELERFGDDLFTAVDYLEGEGVWHRDIKPDNLAIRRLANNNRRLVLFDFSLAGVADKATRAGTPPYLDPFLGTDRRPFYDAHAERYALAVTLHEMASAEHPAWGDGVTEPKLLDPAEQVPQLAEDRFDPGLRDGLVAFFRRALHRDAAQRFASLKEMRDAWRDVFRDLDATAPPTTPDTAHDEPADAAEARDRAAEVATAQTPLAAAGLSPRALSVAEQELGVTTVGELIKIPSTRIQRLRGVGVGPRNELIRRAREWRKRLQVAESPAAVAREEAGQRSPQAATAAPAPAGRDAEESVEDLARLSLDEVARRLLPKDTGRNTLEVQAARYALALPGEDGTPSPVPPWAPQKAIADALYTSQPYVAQLLRRSRERWSRSPLVTALRAELVEILAANGRVMEAGELAAEMLARRGSSLVGPAERLALAGAAVRAAIETEERLENPRIVKRRSGDRVLVALCAEGDPTVPSDVALLDYAEKLGRRADELAARDPLPGFRTAIEELRAVPAPDGMPLLPDTRLVALAAAASANAAVTPRFELYPKDLDPVRAVRLAQAGSYTGEPGIGPEKLRERVLARFPALTTLPGHPELRDVLREAGYEVQIKDGKYVSPAATGTRSASRAASTGTVTRTPAAVRRDEARLRLDSALERGGFLAVKVRLADAGQARDALLSREGVTGVDVTAEFVAALRDIVAARGKPRWETVLVADTPEASPTARAGFARLVAEAWQRLEERVRGVPGVALLHGATPLARYTGGPELLARLAEAARQADESPYGLWLLCPMEDPREWPRLDDHVVGVLGENEQLALPRDCFDVIGNATGARRVS
ncbi:BREX system serine/threonine kinase PglW [Carbonactinospora thermoautotrophica]|uniref:BREX system serine/threonine kinase PglW n=1 Tax=Carbonactinospora thermoautotrophica TaxID=1469144 RepID=UPI003DA7EC59